MYDKNLVKHSCFLKWSIISKYVQNTPFSFCKWSLILNLIIIYSMFQSRWFILSKQIGISNKKHIYSILYWVDIWIPPNIPHKKSKWEVNQGKLQGKDDQCQGKKNVWSFLYIFRNSSFALGSVASSYLTEPTIGLTFILYPIMRDSKDWMLQFKIFFCNSAQFWNWYPPLPYSRPLRIGWLTHSRATDGSNLGLYQMIHCCFLHIHRFIWWAFIIFL